MDDKDREIQKIKEHNYVLWAVIALLSVTLVNIFAQKTCWNQAFVDQVSFASTISSIILSVIAIIMTVVSSDSMNNLLHKFRDLCDALQDSPKKIEHSTNSIVESSRKLEEVKTDIQKLPEIFQQNQESLNAILSSIKETISQLDGKILEIKSNTDNMTQQLSSVNDKMQSLNITGTKPNDYKLLNDVELRTILFHEFSYWNLCLLYALKIAYENKQEIILYDNLVNVIGDEKNSAEEKYFFSFLQCLSYFRLAKLDRKGNKYKIISLNQILSNGIEEALDKFKINHPTPDPSIDVETDKHNIYESIVKTN